MASGDPIMIVRNNGNKRAQQTKLLLFNALLELMRDTEYKGINIKLLSERAGIARQTFYRYFTSIDAVLIEEMTRRFDIFFESIEDSLHSKDYQQVSKAILASLKVDDDLFIAIHKVGLSYKLYLPYLEYAKKVKKTASNVNKLTSKDLLLTEFYAGGLYILLNDWIGNNTDVPLEELTEVLIDALEFLIQK